MLRVNVVSLDSITVEFSFVSEPPSVMVSPGPPILIVQAPGDTLLAMFTVDMPEPFARFIVVREFAPPTVKEGPDDDSRSFVIKNVLNAEIVAFVDCIPIALDKIAVVFVAILFVLVVMFVV